MNKPYKGKGQINLRNWQDLYTKGSEMFFDMGKNISQRRKNNKNLNYNTTMHQRGYPFYNRNENVVGPWKGGKKALSLSKEILNKGNISTSKLTPEECTGKINDLIVSEANKNKVYETTAWVGSKTTDSQASEKKVIKLDREKRHTFEVKESMLIQIDETCWDKICCWMNMTEKEISGLGCVQHIAGGIFNVYDVFLFEQENTSTFTDIDDAAVQKLMIELDEMDDKDGGTRFKDLRFWWHSHGNHEVNWSTQDDNNIQEKLFGESTEGKPICPWWVSVVVNKKKSVNTRIDIADPWLTLSRASYRIKHNANPEIEEFCKKEYNKKVREKEAIETTSVYGGYGGRSGYDLYSDYDWYNKSSAITKYDPKKADDAISTGLRMDRDKYAIIPCPAPGSISQQLDIVGAYKAWEKEIINGMAWIYNLIIERKITGIKNIGLCFRPIKIGSVKQVLYHDTDTKTDVMIDEQYEWTFSGSVKTDDYILTVYPGNTLLHLGRITDITRVCSNDTRISLKAKSTNDVFDKIGLIVSPNWEYTGKGCERVVAIIFSVPNKLPEDLLGDILLSDDEAATIEVKRDTEKDEDDNWDEDDILWEEKPDTDLDLYGKLIDYAEKQTRIGIISRVEDWLREMGREDLINAIEELSDSIDSTKPESCIAMDLEKRTREELLELASVMCDLDPTEAFAGVQMLIPSVSYCPDCYEPLESTKVLECPHCKIHLTWSS